MRAWYGNSTIIIDGQNYSIDVGDIKLDGQRGSAYMGDSIKLDGRKCSVVMKDSKLKDSIILDGEKGSVTLKDSITLDGEEGDIFFNNADCAEDFDISEPTEAEPGTVMVISDEGKLERSSKTYAKSVAGVISGAGDHKPGFVLDKKRSDDRRRSISLMGKVYCKVEADSSPIEVGDLLTTSSTPGHAMKAIDPLKAFGAVIGKSLCPLRSGKGLIPILIALQ